MRAKPGNGGEEEEESVNKKALPFSLCLIFISIERSTRTKRMHYSREGRGQMSTQRLSSDLNHVKREKEGEDKKEQYLFRDCAADLRIFERGVWLVLHVGDEECDSNATLPRKEEITVTQVAS